LEIVNADNFLSTTEVAITTTVEFGIGCVLVILVLSDIFRTILLPHPTHRALRLEPLLGTFFVPVWLRVTGWLPSGNARQTLRAILGPLLIVMSLMIWVAFLNLGYALVLHAVAYDIQPTASFPDAIYYASSAFLTLGVEGAHATGLARGVLVVAGFSGFAILTIVATFLLSVQSALDRREVLVLSIATTAGRPPSGLSILETYARAGLSGSLAGLFRDWEKWAADVLHSHRANPVLGHFRSADEDGEWLAAFGAVMDAASLLLATVDEKGAQQAEATARLLLPMGTRTITDFAALFQVTERHDDSDVCDSLNFHELRRRLAEVGYPLIEDEATARRRFNQLRGEYHSKLLALCGHFGIELPYRLTEDTNPSAGKVIAETRPHG
jgi:hypothetical protein